MAGWSLCVAGGCRIFDEATVENLELESTVTIQQVVIRKSNLSFPTAVLGLETAVKTLYVCDTEVVAMAERRLIPDFCSCFAFVVVVVFWSTIRLRDLLS